MSSFLREKSYMSDEKPKRAVMVVVISHFHSFYLHSPGNLFPDVL